MPFFLAVRLSDPGRLLEDPDVAAPIEAAHENLIADTITGEDGIPLDRNMIAPEHSPDDSDEWLARPFIASFEAAVDALRAAVAIQRGARAGITGDLQQQLRGPRLQSAISVFSDAAYTPDARMKRCGSVWGGQIVCDRTTYEAVTATDDGLGRAFQWQDAPRGAAHVEGAMECLYDDPLTLTNAPFERAFTEEIRRWVRPRRQHRDQRRAAAQARLNTTLAAAGRGQPLTPLEHALQRAVEERRPSAADLCWPERPDVRNDLVGLALSGGGMRSAVFSLGVAQALARHGFLEDVDYISAVSGGGYTASSLASLWAEDLPYRDPTRLGAGPADFPYAYPRSPLTEDPATPHQLPTHGNESPALRHVRQNARFLVGPGDAPRTTLMAGTILFSVALLWALFLLPPITFAALLALGFRDLLHHFAIWQRLSFVIAGGSFVLTFVLLIAEAGLSRVTHRLVHTVAHAVLGVATLVTVMLVFGVFTSGAGFPGLWETWRRYFALSPIFLFALAILLADVASILSPGSRVRAPLNDIAAAFTRVSLAIASLLVMVLAVWGFDRLAYILPDEGQRKAVFGGVASVIGGIGSVTGLSTSKLLGKPQATSRLWTAGMVIGGYLLLGAGIVIGSWGLWRAEQRDAFWLFTLGFSITGAALVVLLVLAGRGRALLNWSSLHRLYSTMIERTWIIAARDATPPAGSPSPTWTRVWTRPDMTMAKLRASDSPPLPPYLLLCTTLNLPGSTGPKLLDRKGESFVIAPIVSGSALTRWELTEKQEQLDDMPLAQAAAISGAAVSPNMGEHTSTTVSVITTLLNIRLGRWLDNPRTTLLGWPASWLMSRPIVLYWKELLGRASRDDGHVYLSDGGHFENLGVYELFRRRCRYIIAVAADNGSLDEPFDLSNLGKALRLARVDFGVQVDLGPLAPLMHDPTTGAVRTFFAAGELTYPTSSPDGDAPGVFIFIKTGIVERDLTADVLDYWRDEHTAFPYDQTIDERFDQPQFESYRQLGYIAARQMCRAASDARGTAARFAAVRNTYARRIRRAEFTAAVPPGGNGHAPATPSGIGAF